MTKRVPDDSKTPPDDKLTLRDEANAIVAFAFRNGPIEDLHTGMHSALLEDESLSRITDAEMKKIMISACRMVEELIRTLFRSWMYARRIGNTTSDTAGLGMLK